MGAKLCDTGYRERDHIQLLSRVESRLEEAGRT